MLTFVCILKFCFVNFYNNKWQKKTIVLINQTFQLKAMLTLYSLAKVTCGKFGLFYDLFPQ